ncbi:LysR family transcriptional regulator [Burkholderia pseudomallei]|uniref:Imm52 family immunity protein n=1 Tax=Burkholderia pseudomallei TaxID=28450 RepID=UPI000F08651A|nr:Imm52 family immunity protein [Burkholderia pseudomallei]VBT21791.1 LysR family transcriptional regulator [Burkholderia pseudomallei]
MDTSLIFRLPNQSLPSEEEQLRDLWKVALLLEPCGLPLTKWYPPADTPEHSLLNEAFDANGPTTAALAILRTEEQANSVEGLRIAGVWNGKEDDGAAVMTSSLSAVEGNPICSFKLSTKRVEAFHNKEQVLAVLKGLLEIWPALTMEFGPYKYFSMQQTFPNKPGAGWMLYLPRAIEANQLPEAHELVRVMDGRKQRGTIVVSIADEAFSAENVEHVKAANAIEVRLADQGLLPRYADL